VVAVVGSSEKGIVSELDKKECIMSKRHVHIGALHCERSPGVSLDAFATG
jgi:hypothetical protein